jgi:hypothetical protein
MKMVFNPNYYAISVKSKVKAWIASSQKALLATTEGLGCCHENVSIPQPTRGEVNSAYVKKRIFVFRASA